jgi:cyclopropane-fatty-acyl-phospholipid synthase
MASDAQTLIQDAFKAVDIEVGGKRPWDIQVHNPAFYGRLLSGGSLGLGESYMDGWWDSPAIDQFIYKILHNRLNDRIPINANVIWNFLLAKLINFQRLRPFNVGQQHYDIGNDLYRAMLDKRLVYSCGYWSSPQHPAQNLAEAQEAKLDLVCRKIGLQEGQRVLDIGSGWGSFLKFAAEKYGAHGVGVTVSKEQAALARELCAGLPVETRLQDYMTLEGSFDHIVSIGMFEHVGPKNYRAYFKKVHSLLKDDGFFLLHTIGNNITTQNEPWSAKYIFPDGVVPSIEQIGRANDDIFSMEDWHNFGPDYDKTLMAWHANFEASWDSLKGSYDERFHRMWRYYLLTCAASFRVRYLQLWQIVFTKIGAKERYASVR